jgi:hypothetical protein
MMRRREFLMSPILMSWLLLAYAPRLGEIRYCRVSDEGLLDIVPPGCIAEVDPASQGATFLGTTATLFVNRGSWQLFPATEV